MADDKTVKDSSVDLLDEEYGAQETREKTLLDKIFLCCSCAPWRYRTRGQKICTVISAIFGVLLLAAIGVSAWQLWPAGPSDEAKAMMAAGGSSEAVVWEFVPDGSKQQVICAMPKSGIISYNDSVGVVFYPGAKVENEAYVLLAHDVARDAKTLFCITDSTLNMAIINVDAAEVIYNQMGNLAKTWVVGGHSMGGAAASMYMAKPEANPAFRGMMFLASYPAETMHDRTDLTALVVYGTLDGFSYKDLDGWVAEVEALCPANQTTFVKIEGGNHAGFGSYGQGGVAQGFPVNEPEPTISQDEQRRQTVAAIVKYLKTLSGKGPLA